ncbi:MAG: hypothetical protein ACR2OZ_03240 [Verrucomicrobiales bacterium]
MVSPRAVIVGLVADIRNLFRQLWVAPFVLVFWGWIGFCMWAAWFLLLALIFYLRSWKTITEGGSRRWWNAFRAGTRQIVVFLVLPLVAAYVMLIWLVDWPSDWAIDIARLGLVLLLLVSES